ncbi:MAG: YiiX/YebB-like N1pC/P60 family cysteine hydrolase [Gammaproteobacteria bacterium]
MAGVILLAAAWAFAATRVGEPGHAPEPVVLPEALQEGDLVFRTGHDAVSGAVLALDPTPQFSHVGILARRDGIWVVIHSLPPAFPGDVDGVRTEPLRDYLSTGNARRAAVYRLSGDSAQRVQAAVMEAFRHDRNRTSFDGDFDLQDHQRLYCTELVWLAFRKAGIDLAPEPDWLNLPLRAGYYLLPGTLIRSGALRPVS